MMINHGGDDLESDLRNSISETTVVAHQGWISMRKTQFLYLDNFIRQIVSEIDHNGE